ncbi:hypothetical protein [Streptomyces sp. NPDC046832]|uniref:hypothetical protein n=1 Tax=Streptomyces sp. NPDC046832 TaxID=3155020 RepID=UPI0033DC3300
MRLSRRKPLKRQPSHRGHALRNKIILPLASVASAAAAFGIGALVFSSPDTPSDASPVPQPTKTVTAPPVAGQTPTQTAQEDVQRVAAGTEPTSLPTPTQKAATAPSPKTATSTRTTPRKVKPAPGSAPTKPHAGAEGPFADAEDDGKVLDDIAPSLPLPNLPVDVPDKLLPFPGPGYTGPPSTETYTDVVSAPNVITDPDKPWFHLPTTPPEPTDEPAAEVPADSPSVEPEPAPVVTEPVRTGGPVFGRNPFRTLG